MIYVASSWRNPEQPRVVALLRELGLEVYDFRHPAPDDNGFSWREIGEGWLNWTPREFRTALRHPVASRGFNFDMNALRACSACVLVLPCGRSAHLELGYAVGAGKPTAIFWTGKNEPELMYRMVDALCISEGDLGEWAASLRQATPA